MHLKHAIEEGNSVLGIVKEMRTKKRRKFVTGKRVRERKGKL